MELHQKVADFTLQTDEDKTVSLSGYAGQPVILFFYPRANTPGCTIEACGFRDAFTKLQAAGAVVLGISRDTPCLLYTSLRYFCLLLRFLPILDQGQHLFGMARGRDLVEDVQQGLVGANEKGGPLDRCV